MSFLQNRRPGLWVQVAWLAAILVLAAVLRVRQLDTVPPGMTHDEAAFGAEAERILAGERPLYFALGYGHEPLYAYLVALSFTLLGHTLTAIRITSAVCGVLVVLGTYLVARQWFGPRAAVVAAAWMAVAFWPLSLSRQALRAVTLPMLWLPAVWWFWRGLRRTGWVDMGSTTEGDRPRDGRRYLAVVELALAGLFLGGTLYTYMASRVAWLAFPLFIIYLLMRQILLRSRGQPAMGTLRTLLRRGWPGMLVFLGVAGLVALPLMLYLQAHPADEIRVGLMLEPVRELLAGRPERVLRHAWNALRLFSWVGDEFWGYNIPGRPVFGWAGSLVFYGALALALWRWSDPRSAFLLLWLGAGMAPAMITTNQGIFLRAIVAQPAVYILLGAGLAALADAARRIDLSYGAIPRSEWRRFTWLTAHAMELIWTVLAVGLIAHEGVRTYQAYFVDWPARPETRNIYNHNLVTAARALRDEPPGSVVAVSALYPLYYHDPWIVRYVTGRDDLALRWFDGRSCIVYPDTTEARYVFSALTLPDPALEAQFSAQAIPLSRRYLSVDDENPYLEFWRWSGFETLATELTQIAAESRMWIGSIDSIPEDGAAESVGMTGLAVFGDLIELAGYRLNGASVAPGDTVELVSYWRALRTAHDEDNWVTFVHLLDAAGGYLGGVDVLGCPPTGWLPGDVVVQVHRFVVPAGALHGTVAYLEMGFYQRPDRRLQVQIEGLPVDNRVLLAPVTIE